MMASIRILIIEDDEKEALLLEQTLVHQLPDTMVQSCLDIGQLKTYIKSFDPHLILADYQLGKTNSLDALQEIKSSAQVLPVIVVTGALDQNGAAHCIQWGAADCLFKDDLARLGTAVQKTLHKNNATRERQQLTRGLREVINLADELAKCSDVETLLQRAVELPRERLGVERCSIFLSQEDEYRGTYGTNMQGETTDEHAEVLPPRFVESLKKNSSRAQRWVVLDEPCDRGATTSRWCAVTPIPVAGDPMAAIFCNDAAISLKAMDTVLQDILTLYGNLVGDFITVQKATERERLLHQRLDRTTRMESLGLLAGGLAHDLNNILSPLASYPDILLSQLPPTSQTQSMLIDMRNAATDAFDLLKDVQALVQYEEHPHKPVSINQIVQRTVNSVAIQEPLRTHPALELRIRTRSNLPDILARDQQLSRMILNLALNAFEAMSGAGTLTLSTALRVLDQPFEGFESIPDGTFVVFKAEDTGPGMGSEQLQHIFEPFYSKKKHGSAGLGLTVVYNAVHSHGGFIDVQSVPGHGTSFNVYFPVPEQNTNRQSVDHSLNAEPPCSFQGKQALLIDDVDTQRIYISRVLKNMGFEVSTADSGPQGLNLLEQNRYDIIILDMVMADMDGLETLKRIRSKHPDQLCFIVSGFSQNQRVQEALKQGASAFLKKPLKQETLQPLLTKWMCESRQPGQSSGPDAP